jgi:hypothetical protein
MISVSTVEGVLSDKPVLLESSRSERATEFNLEHSDLTGEQPLVYSWRCRATGALAQEISERTIKGQTLVVSGKFIQERKDDDGEVYTIVKFRVEQCSFGRLRSSNFQ